MTLTGFETATFRLEAQCLNQLHHGVLLVARRYMKLARNQYLDRNGAVEEYCSRPGAWFTVSWKDICPTLSLGDCLTDIRFLRRG